MDDAQALLDDPSIDLIVLGRGAARPRAALAVEAMRRGKDVMVDKPGVTSFDELAPSRRRSRETGRIFSICFSERFVVPSTDRRRQARSRTAPSAAWCRRSASGRIASTAAIRPDWFFDPSGLRRHPRSTSRRIRSTSSCHFTGSRGRARSSRAPSAISASATCPDFEDFGEILLRSDRAARLHPGRLVHARRPADLGRRPALHPRHGGHDRAAEICRPRRPARDRPPLPGRSHAAPGTSTAAASR